MDWASRYLTPNESVAMIVHRHIAVLGKPFAIELATLLFFLMAPAEFTFYILLGVTGYFLWHYLEWRFDRLVVTDQRVVLSTGVLTRRVASMPVAAVTDMTYRRTIPGRVLGYGALVLESAGQDQALSNINYLPDSDNFYRAVTDLVATKSANVVFDVAQMERQGVGLVSTQESAAQANDDAAHDAEPRSQDASASTKVYDRESDERSREGETDDEDDTDPFMRLDSFTDN